MSTSSTRKPPAFPLYAQDFLVGTTFMTPAQRGGYVVLLCHQWVHGGLPDNLESAALLSGISGIDLALVWQKFACDSDGMRRNARLERVRAELGAFSAKQSGNAKKGWEKRRNAPRKNAKGNAKSDAKGVPKTCSSSSSSYTPIVPKGDAGDDDEKIVSAIWNGHPQRGRTRSSQAKVAAAWKAIPKRERPSLEAITSSLARWRACEDWRKQGGQYVPGAHLWVKDRKWTVTPAEDDAGKQGEGFVSCHEIGQI